MANFKNKSINAHSVYQGDVVYAYPPSKGALVVDLLATLRADVETAGQDGRLPVDVAERARLEVASAEVAAVEPEPQPGRVVAALRNLTSLAAGLSSAAGIVRSADSIISTISGT